MARLTFDEATRLYLDTKHKIMQPNIWLNFLDTACRNFRLPFDEQVLVYAQRPDVTAVLPTAEWNHWFTYCALRDKETADGTVDLLVREEDAPKINRIVERYGLIQVDAQIETEEQPEQDERAENPTPGREMPPREARDEETQQAGMDSTGQEIPSQNGSKSTGIDLSSDRPSVLEQMHQQPEIIKKVKSDVDTIFRLALYAPKFHSDLREKHYIVDSATVHTLLDTYVYSELRERAGYMVIEQKGDIVVQDPESGLYIGLGRSFGEGYSRDGMWNRLCGEFKRRDEAAAPVAAKTPDIPTPTLPSLSGHDMPDLKTR